MFVLSLAVSLFEVTRKNRTYSFPDGEKVPAAAAVQYQLPTAEAVE